MGLATHQLTPGRGKNNGLFTCRGGWGVAGIELWGGLAGFRNSEVG